MRRWPTWRADLVTGAFTLGGSVLLGAPAGLAWSGLAPHVRVTVSASGAALANPESEAFIAGDAVFLLLTALLGLVLGILVWYAAPEGGPLLVVALAAGGALGSAVAALVGQQPGHHQLIEAAARGAPASLTANVALQAHILLLAWPLAALAAYLALTAYRPPEDRQP